MPRLTWPSLFTALMYAFMYFPIVVLGVYSFNRFALQRRLGGF
jgi:spermidine/putrescine transport system permease protein